MRRPPRSRSAPGTSFSASATAFEQHRGEQDALVRRRAAAFSCVEPIQRSRHVDGRPEIVVRDLALRFRHGGGDGLAHRRLLVRRAGAAADLPSALAARSTSAIGITPLRSGRRDQRDRSTPSSSAQPPSGGRNLDAGLPAPARRGCRRSAAARLVPGWAGAAAAQQPGRPPQLRPAQAREHFADRHLRAGLDQQLRRPRRLPRSPPRPRPSASRPPPRLGRACTRWPGLTSHSTSVPDSMSAPSEGMRNSVMSAPPVFAAAHDAGHLRQRGVLHVLRVRHRHLARCTRAPPAHPGRRRRPPRCAR